MRGGASMPHTASLITACPGKVFVRAQREAATRRSSAVMVTGTAQRLVWMRMAVADAQPATSPVGHWHYRGWGTWAGLPVIPSKRGATTS